MHRQLLVNTTILILLFWSGESTKSEPKPKLPFGFPFLRGGSTAVATRSRKRSKLRKQLRNRQFSTPRKLILLQQGLEKVGGRIQSDAVKQWKDVQIIVGKEWSEFLANIPRLPSKKFSRASKLDDVLQTFSTVLQGNDVDMAQLLKACRSHLALMKSGGSSLRLVAKDLESNLQKAEALYKKNPKGCRQLTSLLEAERESGIHNGNVLRDPSAAIGLLWIRRSLAFQSDLYASLIPQDGQHPRDAALDAYEKHLSPYHGWALRKVFPASLSHMPEREAFIAKFGGIEIDELEDEYEREIVKKLRSLVATWGPLIGTWEDDFERLGLEDTRRV